MSLNPRAIATLGIGYGPRPMAMLGLWPVDGVIVQPPKPDFIPGGALLPGKRSRLRHAARADTALRLRCAISASARLALPAAVAVDAAAGLKSTAALRLSAMAEMAAGTGIAAGAEVRDEVLEMLLMAD
jgi:hypothetical protein